MNPKSEDWTLRPNKYAGTLTIAGEVRPATFSAEAGKDHRCKVELDPVDRDTYLLSHRHFGRSGLPSANFELAGTASNGDTFFSRRVSIGGCGAGEDGFRVRLLVPEASVSVKLEKKQERPILRKWFRAFRSFRNSIQHTALGDLLVYGSEKTIDPNDVSGCVCIQAPANCEEEDWRQKAESLLTHMHYGLSFAHGGRLQVPHVDYVAGHEWDATFYSGGGFAPEMALQHFLNHDPFIKALINGFFDKGPLDDGFLTALGWLQMPTTFDEIRFLSAMTALEVLVDTQLSAADKGGVMKKPDFRAIRNKLNDAIDAVEGVEAEAKEIFKGKISDLNKKVLSQKIDLLFKRLSIPTRDFDTKTIKRLTSVRNDIVHRGIVPNGADIWAEIILIRELINRILMGAIGFEGRYLCYIGGEHERTFPDLLDFSPQES